MADRDECIELVEISNFLSIVDTNSQSNDFMENDRKRIVYTLFYLSLYSEINQIFSNEKIEYIGKEFLNIVDEVDFYHTYLKFQNNYYRELKSVYYNQQLGNVTDFDSLIARIFDDIEYGNLFVIKGFA